MPKVNTPIVRHRKRPSKTVTTGGHDPHKPVGYGNPPRASQFKKGQSGNPNGRPKAKKSARDIIKAALFAPVTIREGGRTRRISTLEALMKRLRKDALEGDLKATDRLLKLMQLEAHETQKQEDDAGPAFNPKDDDRILKELLEWTQEKNFDPAASLDPQEG